MERPVEFVSLGATLRGRLFLPDDCNRRPPIVVMAHGYSATIDGMVADRYAEEFRAAGLAALLYDHRGFGRSDGTPRRRIDRWSQAIGYADAIAFAAGLDDVDTSRLAVWGDSLSAGCALIAAAFDRRVGALVAQVPALGSSLPPSDPTGAIVGSMAGAYARRTLCQPIGEIGPLPVVSPDQIHAPSALTPLTAFRWFMTYGARFGTGWANDVTIAERGPEEPYEPVLAARRLRVPALFLVAHDDEMPGAVPSIALAAYEAAGDRGELLELDGGHFGLLYHPSPTFDLAARTETAFLRRHLS